MPRQAKSFGRKLDCADIASSRETRKGYNQIVTMAGDLDRCAAAKSSQRPFIGKPLYRRRLTFKSLRTHVSS